MEQQQVDQEEREKRLQALGEGLGKTWRALREQRNEDTPYWYWAVALELCKKGLVSLQHYLADPESPEVTWSSLWTWLEWDIRWNWETNEPLPQKALTDEELLSGSEDTITAAAELYAYMETIDVLEGMTQGLAFITRGGEETDYTFLSDNASKRYFDQLETEEERMAFLVELSHPTPIGNVDWEHKPRYAINQQRMKVGKDLGEMLTFEMDVADGTIEVRPVIQFSPLVVDEDERRAYYPLQVELMVLPVEKEHEAVMWPPLGARSGELLGLSLQIY